MSLEVGSINYHTSRLFSLKYTLCYVQWYSLHSVGNDASDQTNLFWSSSSAQTHAGHTEIICSHKSRCQTKRSRLDNEIIAACVPGTAADTEVGSEERFTLHAPQIQGARIETPVCR